jgi:ketosteroid isomerase-like protein
MIDRVEVEHLLNELYAARLRGDLDGVCGTFCDDAVFRLAGASNVSPVGVMSVGIGQFRPLLALMIKSFKLSDHARLSSVIDGAKAAVHWRVRVHSKITGTTMLTELIDLIEIKNRRIVSYVEFFVPCSLP